MLHDGTRIFLLKLSERANSQSEWNLILPAYHLGSYGNRLWQNIIHL